MSNMSRRNNSTVDKFGRQKNNGKGRVVRGPPGVGFMLTSDGQYDMQGKSLENVALPNKDNDAATQEYVLHQIVLLRVQLVESVNRDIKQFFEKAHLGFDQRLNAINELIMENDLKYYRDGASQEYVGGVIDQLRIQLTNLINVEIREYFERKYTRIEEKLNELNVLVMKNEVTIDNVNKDINIYFEQKCKGLEEKINILKEIVMDRKMKAEAIQKKISTWFD